MKLYDLESNLTDFSTYVENQSNMTERMAGLELNLADLTAANKLANENNDINFSSIMVENKNLNDLYNFEQNQRLVIIRVKIHNLHKVSNIEGRGKILKFSIYLVLRLLVSFKTISLNTRKMEDITPVQSIIFFNRSSSNKPTNVKRDIIKG